MRFEIQLLVSAALEAAGLMIHVIDWGTLQSLYDD